MKQYKINYIDTKYVDNNDEKYHNISLKKLTFMNKLCMRFSFINLIIIDM